MIIYQKKISQYMLSLQPYIYIYVSYGQNENSLATQK